MLSIKFHFESTNKISTKWRAFQTVA